MAVNTKTKVMMTLRRVRRGWKTITKNLGVMNYINAMYPPMNTTNTQFHTILNILLTDFPSYV